MDESTNDSLEVDPLDPKNQKKKAPIVEATTPDLSVGDYVSDIGTGLVRGAEGAVRGVRQAARGIAKATGLEDLVGDAETNDAPLKYKSADPKSVVGHVTADITQAAIGYGIGGVALRGVKFASGVGGAMAQSAVGTPLVADVNQERISNTLLQYPWLQPAAALIAQDPTDSVILAKAKAGLEDVLTTGAAGAIFKGLHLLYLKSTGKGTAKEIAAAEKELVAAHAEASSEHEAASVGVEPSTNGAIPSDLADHAGFQSGSGSFPGFDLYNLKKDIPGHPAGSTVSADTITEFLNPVVNNQASKDALKAQLTKDYSEGATGYAYRGMSSDAELKEIAKTGKLQVGADAEGVPGISAAHITKDGFPVYGDGQHGFISKTGQHAESGRVGEVLVNEATNPADLQYVVKGKVMSFDEMKLHYNGAEKPKPSVITRLTTPTGEHLIDLTPAKITRIDKLLQKTAITEAAGKLEKPAAGPSLGGPNPKYTDAANGPVEAMVEVGKIFKSSLGPHHVAMEDAHAAADIFSKDVPALMSQLKLITGSLENAESYLLAGRQVAAGESTKLMAMVRKQLTSGPGTAEETEAYHASILMMAELDAQVSSIASRMARGLRSQQEVVAPFDGAKLLAKLKNPEESEKLLRLLDACDGDATKVMHVIKVQQMSWFQKAVGAHNEYWTGLGLLSRFATQTVNIASTAINSMIAEPMSMMVGGTLRGLAGKGWQEAREGVAMYNGFRTSFFDSVDMSWRAMKSEQAILSQAGTMEQKTQYISALTWNMNPDSYMGKVIDGFGEITRASFRGLTGGDEFFKQMSYRAKVSASASREAMDMVRAGTLPKSGIAGYVQGALQKAIDQTLDPLTGQINGRALNEAALKYAEKATFVSDLKGQTWGDYASMGEGIARLAGQNQLIRGTLLPFIKTPTNVTRTTFEYTPLIGQLRKQFYHDVFVEGGEKAALAIGKLTIGSSMYVGAGMLALEGRITGSPPPTGVIMPKGWKPYSIKFEGQGEDGGDLYVSYQRLQPFGDVLGLTADFARSTGMLGVSEQEGLAQAMSLALTKLMDSSPVDAAISVGSSYSNSLISKTYFRNLTEFFSTFSGYNSEDKMLRWWQNYAASHVPGALSQLNSDDTVREVRTTMDAMMSRIPGLSQELPAKRDYFGDIHDVKVGYPWSIIQPLAVSQTTGDPVMEELNRLSKGNAGMKFQEPDHFLTVGGQRLDLKKIVDDEGITAYDRMCELMQEVKPKGQSLNFHDKLEKVMTSGRYKRDTEDDGLDGSPLNPGLRQVMIKAQEEAYRTAARDQMMSEFKDELGIPSGQSVLRAQLQDKITRQKARVGVKDTLLDLANSN